MRNDECEAEDRRNASSVPASTGCTKRKSNSTDNEEDEKQLLNPDLQIARSMPTRPPDGGWGWLVAAGGLINSAMLPLVFFSFSIVLLHFLLDLETSSATNAWIINIEGFIYNMVGLVAGPLACEFGDRPVAMFGALSMSLGIILSAFAPSAGFLYFTHAILGGIGSGITVSLSILIIPKFFERRRGRANSIVMSGFCIGSMVWPPLTTYFVEEYGFRGGALLVGGVLLNSCVAAAVFHPAQWHMKADKAIVISSAAKSDLYGGKSLSMNSNDKEKNNSYALTETLTEAPKTASKDTQADNGETNTTAKSDKVSRCLVIIDIFDRVIIKTKSNMRSLRSRRVLLVALANTFYIPGHNNFMIMVSFVMEAAGHSLNSIAWCLSISGICNIIARITVNALSDASWFNLKKFYVASLAVLAVCSFLFPLINKMIWLMIVAGLWGFAAGATMGVYGQIMIAAVGKDNFEACFGTNCFLVGFGYIILGPLIGYVRDISSSYTLSMWMPAGFITVSFALWLFMPCATSYDRKKELEGTGIGDP